MLRTLVIRRRDRAPLESDIKDSKQMKSYLLRVMAPGSVEGVLGDFEADAPFGSIAAGDLLNLPELRREGVDPLLRVVAVEHLISTREGFSHFIRLFTEVAPDNRETRVGSP
jgi:hypothetical protein